MFVPKARTTDQVELDTALEPLDQRGRHALQTMITQFDQAFADPSAVQGTLDATAPTMEPLSRALEAMRGTQPGTDLPRLVLQTSKAMGALARDENALGGVIDSGNVALGATAARSADLSATVNTAPAAMAETRTTMARLEQTLNAVDPLAERLIPGAQRLDGAAQRTQVALKAAVPLLRDLRPTFRDLDPAVKDLSVAARTGTPAFGPLSNVMDRTKTVFIPWLNDKNASNHRPNYQNVGPAVASVSTATSWGDVNGPVANFEAAAGENALVDSPCDTAFDNPSAQQLIQCELFTRVFAGALTGRNPATVKTKDSAVPHSKLLPYLMGRARLAEHPHLKPLRIARGTK
jgi:phospholipid/cholesterol/gamma-HCH transport system substrate-binding protein